MARGMEAENDLGARRAFDAEALDADGNTTVGADLQSGANTPNIRPPGAARGWAQDRAFCFHGEVPSFLWGQAQLAVRFVGVAMQTQGVDVWVGGFDVGDLLAGEIGWEPSLPELVFTLHFSFGLRGWGIKKANVVELECPAELRQRVGIIREKNGVVIDVDLEWSAVEEERGGQEIEVRKEQFSIVEFGTDEQAAAIVEHIEHGKVQGGGGKPAMG